MLKSKNEIKKKEIIHHFYKNPSVLTPCEQRIHELRQQGLKWKEIAKIIGSGSANTISSRYTAIKQKLESAEWEKES